jgi:hypothetical protein
VNEEEEEEEEVQGLLLICGLVLCPCLLKSTET